DVIIFRFSLLIFFIFCSYVVHPVLHSFPTRRSSDLGLSAGRYWLAFWEKLLQPVVTGVLVLMAISFIFGPLRSVTLGQRLFTGRSEEHTSELQSRFDLVCRLLLEKKNTIYEFIS